MASVSFPAKHEGHVLRKRVFGDVRLGNTDTSLLNYKGKLEYWTSVTSELWIRNNENGNQKYFIPQTMTQTKKIHKLALRLLVVITWFHLFWDYMFCVCVVWKWGWLFFTCLLFYYSRWRQNDLNCNYLLKLMYYMYMYHITERKIKLEVGTFGLAPKGITYLWSEIQRRWKRRLTLSLLSAYGIKEFCFYLA